MIEITLKGWEEGDLQHRVVNKCVERILYTEFKPDRDEDDYYTPHDKFKNQIANLVADRIYEYMINNEEIEKRIDKAISNAEKTIVKQYMIRK